MPYQLKTSPVFFLNFLLLVLCPQLIAQTTSTDCDPEPTIGMVIDYQMSIDCDFHEVGDLDTYHFQGSAGDQPYIQVRGAGSKRLFLRGPNNENVYTDNWCTTQCISNEVLPETGTYTIMVEHWKPSGNASPIGDYVLELPCLAGSCVTLPVPASTLGYIAVDPCRIVDTRRDNLGGAWAGKIRSFKVVPEDADFTIYGGNDQGCGIPNGATSIYVNLTAVSPQHNGFLRAWAWPKEEPNATVFAWNAGFGATNAVPIPMCKEENCTENINVKIFAQEPVDLVVDVLGYFVN